MEQPSLSYPCYSRSSRANSNHADLLEAFKDYLLQERGVLEPNVQLGIADSFLSLLDASHCRLNEIRAAHIQRFITEQGHYYQRKTIAAIASFLRNFLRYLAFNRIVAQELSESVRRPCIFQREREPRYLQDWQVRQVLGSVDQGTVEGKRDYALLLLLAVYGLRAREITGLCIDDCRWRAGKLLIRNRKCGDALELPLTAQVAESLVAYLRERPKTEHREIFLNIMCPHLPMRTPALCKIASNAIKRCGFKVIRAGTHTFRYSRAQALFAKQFPLPQIASTLGHRDLRTTLGYLAFTVHPLRELALNAGEDLA